MHTYEAAARTSVLARRVTQLLLVAGPFAGMLLLVVSGVDGATRPGYEPMRHWISHLALGDRGWLGVANLVVSGTLLAASSFGLRRALDPRRAAWWAARLVLLAGIGLVVSGVFPIDPGLNYPPGAQATHSLTGTVHDLAAIVVFSSLAGASVLLGRSLRDVRGAAFFGQVIAAVVVLSIIVCSALVALDYAGALPHAPSGFMERVAVFVGLAWFGAVATYLLRNPQR